MNHDQLLDALRDAGHNVEKWADDPSMLRAYAEAIEFDAKSVTSDEDDSLAEATS